MRRPVVTLALFYACVAGLGRAQEFRILDRSVQVHGYASQGFVHTNNNNWLTMYTSHVGSGEFTEFGVNASSQISDHLRAGVQIYDRNLGHLGNWHPSLDWAFVDYRYRPWLGVRAGKVKTVLGLYNDTQDLDFVRTFALLPQSVYPTDLRDATIAHLGGDLYGSVPLPRDLGPLSYTAYAGRRNDSTQSGYPYLLSQFQTQFRSFSALQYGGDLRWKTPAKGLLIGASRLNQDTEGSGTSVNPANPGAGRIAYSECSKADWMNQFYGQYTFSKFRIDSEYRRYLRNQSVFSGTATNITDVRGWYVAGTYRAFKRLEFSSYYSHYTIVSLVGGALLDVGISQETDTSSPNNHIYDKVVAARIDLNRFWNLQIEGHFMAGYGNSTYPDGFYPQVNPNGFKADTNALVVKTSMSF